LAFAFSRQASVAPWQAVVSFRQAFIHPFPMGVHFVYYFFFNGLCPGLVDIHPGGESTSKDLKFLVIGVYPGFHLF
jgi:hypothetical protein